MTNPRLEQRLSCLNTTCDYEFDAASDLTGLIAPKPGDVSICFRCGHLQVFASSKNNGKIDSLTEIDADTKAYILSIPENRAMIEMVLGRES